MPSCAMGPGMDASWPRKCGITTYLKASANVTAVFPVDESGSGSGEVSSGEVSYGYTAPPTLTIRVPLQ